MRLFLKYTSVALAVSLLSIAAGAPQNAGSAKSATSKSTSKVAPAKPTAQKTKPPQFTATPTVTPSARAATAKSAVTKAGTTKAVATKSVATNTTAPRRARVPGRTRPLPTWHPSQMAPTTDRYREIQQALMDRGYFRGEVSGAWGPESQDALKRFQHDQRIEPDGKLGSLTLISLGLGPKRGAPIVQSFETATESTPNGTANQPSQP